MKKMKRLLSLLLVVTMLCTTGIMSVVGSAATPLQDARAKALFAMGLFKGYDETGTNFGLNDKVNREQALVFLIRMLGEDQAARTWKGTNTFTDIPAGNWAIPYAGYAKEKGYTMGIGDNKFGMGQDATMQQMATFALRGLGYSDAANVKDFSYDTSMTFAVGKAVLESDKPVTPFTRGIAVDILINTLAANVKNTQVDLLSQLMNKGVVSQAQYDNAVKILSGATTAPVEQTLEQKTAAVTERYNDTANRYNALLDKCTKLGMDQDKEFAANVNELTKAFTEVGAAITAANGKLTAEQLTAVTSSLDAIDTFIKEVNAAIK